MRWIIGIDEVGRGPLAGPVCVCAVAIPESQYRRRSWRLPIRLVDSKVMGEGARESWAAHARFLARTGAIRVGIAMRSAGAIDRYGISACIASCITRSIARLDLDPAQCTVLLDGGLQAPAAYRRQRTIIRGDSLHPAISLASIVAKVRRDRHMQAMHQRHPGYGWDANKGYGTAQHRAAIRKHGHTPLHRASFLSGIR